MKRIKKVENGDEDQVRIARSLDKDEVQKDDDNDKKWIRFRRDYTQKERKKLISKCIMDGVETLFHNIHLLV